METLHIVLIVIAVLILIWLIAPSTRSKCLNQLNGFWVADDEFCQNAGIDLMTIFFGDYVDSDQNPKQDYERRYLIWVLIINDSGQFNHITTANIALDGQTHLKGDQYEFAIEFQDVPMDIFPTSLKIQIVPGELITLINPEDDSKVFEGTKNENASKAIEFNIENSES